MPDDQISSEAALIFKGCLFNSENSGIEEMIGHINHIKDWKRFMHLSLDTYLAPVLYKKLNISDLSAYIPPEVMRFLKNSYYKVLADNTRIYNEYNEISRLLSEANIEFIPLKGIFLAEELYKDIGLRHLSDIDILFKEGDINYIRELFLNKNWRLNQPKKSAHYHNLITHHPFSLVNRTLNLEVHTHIHNQLREFQVNIKDYWSRAVKTNESTLKCNLNPTDLLQHLCLHLYVHLSNGHAKVISLYDIALLVNSSEFNINWDLLKKQIASIIVKKKCRLFYIYVKGFFP